MKGLNVTACINVFKIGRYGALIWYGFPGPLKTRRSGGFGDVHFDR